MTTVVEKILYKEVEKDVISEVENLTSKQDIWFDTLTTHRKKKMSNIRNINYHDIYFSGQAVFYTLNQGDSYQQFTVIDDSLFNHDGSIKELRLALLVGGSRYEFRREYYEMLSKLVKRPKHIRTCIDSDKQLYIYNVHLMPILKKCKKIFTATDLV